jgi:hypothetical protein
MEMKADVLIFVEDTGPAHYAAPLPEALYSSGWRSMVYAAGLSREVLWQRHIPFVELDGSVTPESVLQRVRPRLVLTGTSENPDSFGLQLLAAAQYANIMTAAFIDAGTNASYRFRGRSDKALAYAPDWILVPDDWTRDEFIHIGLNADKVIVCGHPQYDHVLNLYKTWTDNDRSRYKQRFLPGISDQQQVVIFLSEGSERVSLLSPLPPMQEYTLRGWGRSKGRTEIIIEELLTAMQALPQRPYLVLRLHPKDRIVDFQAYAEYFDRIDHTSPPLELVFCADLVVGMTSMLLLEASLLGRKTMSIVPRAVEKKWLPTVREEITPCVVNHDEVVTTMTGLLGEGTATQVGHRMYVPAGSLVKFVEFVGKVLNHG